MKTNGQAKKPEQGEGKFSFFCHRECEYFPCHETNDPENFNCLFCYCPLYALGEDCGGAFTYTEEGIKDCSKCLIPHSRRGYRYILGRFHKITALIEKNGGGKKPASGEKHEN